MALSGTLGDFGIADIFQLIGQQQKTGVLHLSSKEEEVHISFKDGNVVKAESAARKRKELLGHMLVRSALITPLQLDAALEEQKRTLRRLGDILVSSGAINRAALKEMTHLQTTETLYLLFGWKQGNYNFEQGDVDYDAEAVTPIRSESVLMEGFRRVDEWPGVRKVITSLRMTFDRLKDLPLESADDGDDDFKLDAAFGDGEPKEKSSSGLSAAERRVFKHYAPTRTVQQYIDLSRLGEFEACKALSNLVAAGYLKPLAPLGREEGESFSKGTADKTPLDRVREVFGKASMTVAVVAALLFVLGKIGLIGPARADAATHLIDPAAQRALAQAQLERIRTAVGVYELEHGDVPENLDALTQEQLLEPSDLHFPWVDRYYYRRTAAKQFVLLPPLR